MGLLPGIYRPPPHLDGPALVRRADALLRRWVELYGEFSPQWLPPAGIVNWQEDAARYLNAHTLPAPTCGVKELPEGRTSQHVLKAEGESPDATDRENRANASPDGGPMGAGQAAAAAPAGGTQPTGEWECWSAFPGFCDWPECACPGGERDPNRSSAVSGVDSTHKGQAK